MQAALAGPPARHDIQRIIAQGDGIAVLGQLVPTPGGRPEASATEFVDVFTLTDDGLLLSCRRFYYAAPN